VAFARTKPKAIHYGSSGVGSTPHLAAELLQSLTGMELVHVPYKGSVPAVSALTGGEIQILFASVAAAIPMIEAKRLKALAVSSVKRVRVLSDVPTVAESGFSGFDVTNTYGIVSPAGTPAAVVKLLNTELQKIVQMDDVRARFTTQGLEAAGSTPEEFRALMQTEIAKWARVIKDANITAN
jgi:tripartite-type tricarboxylate transporter receptor subunit TctC